MSKNKAQITYYRGMLTIELPTDSELCKNFLNNTPSDLYNAAYHIGGTAVWSHIIKLNETFAKHQLFDVKRHINKTEIRNILFRNPIIYSWLTEDNYKSLGLTASELVQHVHRTYRYNSSKKYKDNVQFSESFIKYLEDTFFCDVLVRKSKPSKQAINAFNYIKTELSGDSNENRQQENLAQN